MTLPLDQIRTARPPSDWTGERVKNRLVEAFNTDKRMPGERRFTATGVWPATPLHEWTDVVHWTNPGDTARDRNWQSWENAKGVYSWEVSCMYEAFDWLLWLPADDRIKLQAWAFATSRGMSRRAMLDKRGLKRTTFYRQIDKAAQHIADRLNKESVQMR